MLPVVGIFTMQMYMKHRLDVSTTGRNWTILILRVQEIGREGRGGGKDRGGGRGRGGEY